MEKSFGKLLREEPRQVTLKSANVMRVYALNQMLAAAETAVLTGDEKRAAEYLYELQLYAEKLADLLSPEKESQPSLAAA